jgi:ADP-ribose pyrophosphatase YjhB (NUDIX family)
MVRKRIEQLLGNLLPVIYHLRKAGWFVFRPITLGVRVIVVDDDKVLLVRNHGRGQWHLPGGAVNRNETLIAAARREAYEETGSTIEHVLLQ